MTSHASRLIRLAKLERATIPADDMNPPILLVRAGESEEEAAARQGINLAAVLYALPSNGRKGR